MKIVDKRDLYSLKFNELVELECEQCGNIFKKKATEVRTVLNRPNNKKNLLKFCSISCGQTGKNNVRYKGNPNIYINAKCNFCGINFSKYWIDYNKSKRHFCSKSCNAKYGNKYRLFGKTPRSDFECWLENKLKKDFKNISLIFNNRKILDGLELDIYIPDIKIAFEINGKGHYDPIYGESSLKIRKSIDRKKRYRCLKLGIRLHSVYAKNITKHNKNEYDKVYKKIINKINSYFKRG